MAARRLRPGRRVAVIDSVTAVRPTVYSRLTPLDSSRIASNRPMRSGDRTAPHFRDGRRRLARNRRKPAARRAASPDRCRWRPTRCRGARARATGHRASSCPAAGYDPGANAFAESPCPFQIAATRSKSVSNAAQHPWPRLSTSARGLRLSACPRPAARASTTDEKKGKSGSTQSAHRADAGSACCGRTATEEARGGTETASSSAASTTNRSRRSPVHRSVIEPEPPVPSPEPEPEPRARARPESRSYFLPMQIGIIGGTGHEGRGIAARFAAAGLSVPDRLARPRPCARHGGPSARRVLHASGRGSHQRRGRGSKRRHLSGRAVRRARRAARGSPRPSPARLAGRRISSCR